MQRTVVLFENQVAVRRMLRFAMELQGYRMVEAEDASALMAAVDNPSVKLLVVGAADGGAGEARLVGQVRQQPAGQNLPILLVGDECLRSQWDIRAIGQCAWLTKPIRIGELNSLVEALVERTGRPSPGSSVKPGERFSGRLFGEGTPLPAAEEER